MDLLCKATDGVIFDFFLSDLVEQLTLPSTLMTRVNCSETIPCTASNASDVQWSTSRFRVIFVNTSRLATWVGFMII